MTLISAIKAIRAAATEKDALAILETITTEAEISEREACANVCDELQDIRDEFMEHDGAVGLPHVPKDCAAAIRMRSNAELRPTPEAVAPSTWC